MKKKFLSQYRGLRRELYILFIGKIMTNMGSMIWPILSLILSQKLGMDTTTIAIYTLAVTFLSLPIAYLSGKLADKFNKRNIIIICDLFSVVLFIIAGFLPISIYSVIVFCVASFFQTAEYASYESLVADFTVVKDRDRAFSLMYLGNNIGLVLSPTIAGLLFNNYLNLAFFINGCSILLSTILIFFFIKNIEKEKDESIESQYQNKEIVGGSLKFLFHSPSILIFTIAGAISSFVYGMYNFLMPIDLANLFKDNGSVLYGTLSSLNCITVVVFTAFITKLTHSINDLPKLVIGRIIIILGYVLFLIFMNNIPMCYLSMFVFTIGEIISTISGSPFLTNRIPESHRGRIMSITNIFINLVSSLMNIGAGRIYDNIGSTYAWISIIIIGLFAALLQLCSLSADKKQFPKLYKNGG